jgi:hypothetical protein
MYQSTGLSLPGHCRSNRIKALEERLPTLEACGQNVSSGDLLKQVMLGHLVSVRFLVRTSPHLRQRALEINRSPVTPEVLTQLEIFQSGDLFAAGPNWDRLSTPHKLRQSY